jgi:hypothetical protein
MRALADTPTASASRRAALHWAGLTLGGIVALCAVFLLAIDYQWQLKSTFGEGDSHIREDQCEALREHSIVLEPENTWSNLGYLFGGLLILFRSGKLRGIAAGGFMCATGVTSALYHAVSVNSTLQTLDVASIYWVLLMLIGYAALSLDFHFHAKEHPVVVEKLLIVVAFVAGSIVAVGRLIDSTIAFLVLVGILLVLMVAGCFPPSRQLRALSHREITGFALATVMLGGFAAITRLTDGAGRVGCDPHSPLQNHALWHLFAAALLVLGYDFFARIADQPGERILAD